MANLYQEEQEYDEYLDEENYEVKNINEKTPIYAWILYVLCLLNYSVCNLFLFDLTVYDFYDGSDLKMAGGFFLAAFISEYYAGKTLNKDKLFVKICRIIVSICRGGLWALLTFAIIIGEQEMGIINYFYYFLYTLSLIVVILPFFKKKK